MPECCFPVLLTDGAQEVRFERMVVGWYAWKSVRKVGGHGQRGQKPIADVAGQRFSPHCAARSPHAPSPAFYILAAGIVSVVAALTITETAAGHVGPGR